MEAVRIGGAPGAPAAPEVAVVIVTHNAAEHVAPCLRSVRAAARDTVLEVVVVDNASTDGAPEVVAREMPEARLIRRPDNLGFARACNLAVRHARAPWILLLNPDAVLRPGALAALLRFARARPDAGIVGGRALTPEGALDPHSSGMRPTPWSVVCRAAGLSALAPGSGLLNPEEIGGWARDCERRVDFVVGCLFLVGRPLWDRLGGFDERYFLYGEEADFCLRAARLGLRPAITPSAEVVHAEGASSPGREQQQVWLLTARATLIRRHWRGATARRLGLAALWAGAAARGAVAAPLVSALAPGRAARAAGWRGVWTRRAEWLPGYG